MKHPVCLLLSGTAASINRRCLTASVQPSFLHPTVAKGDAVEAELTQIFVLKTLDLIYFNISEMKVNVSVGNR